MDGLDQLNSLAADLTGAGFRAQGRASAAIRKTALDIEADSRSFAPVDTGNLRNSISSSPTGESRPIRSGDLDVEIGPTAEYGEHVERGTSRNAPAAYMGPAFDRRAPGLVAALEEIGGDIL